MSRLLFCSGIWSGQRLSSDGQHVLEDIDWVLSLTPSEIFPSAFGCSSARTVLLGSWKPTSGIVRLQSQTVGDEISYTGYVEQAHQDDAVVIKGTWQQGDITGLFCCRKEDENDELHVSGIWVGECVPDSSLAGFMIPVNPIRWSLAVVRGTETARVFGAGFFDDTADIPGHPVLSFDLCGSNNHGWITMKKEYERCAETEGVHVDYSGQLEQQSDGSWTISGKWNNPSGGSFGTFTCRRQATEAATASLSLCNKCQQLIPPGQTRYCCRECPVQWTCCSKCHAEEDASIHAHSLHAESVQQLCIARGSSCSELARNALWDFRERPLVGVRCADSVDGYRWATYGDVLHVSVDVLLGLRACAVEAKHFALVCADTSPATIAVTLACVVGGLVLVPVHGALEQESLAHIVSRTQPTVCFVESKYLSKFDAVGSIKHLIEFSSRDLPNPAAGPVENFSRMQLEELVGLGHEARGEGFHPNTLALPSMEPSDMLAVLYTSGSTGVPKGAIFTDELALPSEGFVQVQPYVVMDFQTYDPSFVLSLLSTLQCGGCRAVAAGLETLMEDIQIARPTHIGATPVFWTNLYRRWCLMVSEKTKSGVDSETAKTEVSGRIKGLLGNRLCVATCGGAACPPHVLSFVREQLRIDIVDLYGAREAGGIARGGVVYPQVDIKLLSIPEMGYFADGTPPQGEVCVRSPRLISGYWADDVANAQAFVDIHGQRYYRTGDVGQIVSTRGSTQVRIIDRCSFFFKLCQGEWVSPTKVEIVLEHSAYFEFALVMGNADKNAPVCVVVASPLLLQIEGTAERERKAMEEIRFWCSHARLRAFEVPQAVFVDALSWNSGEIADSTRPDRCFLTSTQKKRYRMLCAHYRGVCEQLYASLESDGPQASSGATSASDADLTPEFTSLLRGVLPLCPPHPDPNATVAELGGDSLTSASLLHALRERGVRLTPAALFEYPLKHLSVLVARAAAQAVDLVDEAPRVDWALECGLPPDLATLISHAGKDVPSPAGKDVLVTGCTGFLGPVLVAQVLRVFSASTVFCVVRATAANVAKQRLQAEMIRAKMLGEGEDLPDRVVVLCGDLSKAALGLSADILSTLAASLAHVFHSGCWVNLSLPYSALKATNVSGTLEVARIALSAHAKFHFVSSVSALGVGEASQERWVDIDVNTLDRKGGYGQTKVVGERLLRSLLPVLDVRVVRASAISGHSESGYTNEMDFTSLLLLVIGQVGACVTPSNARLDWIPVDFVAAATVALAATPSGGVFHLCGNGPRLDYVIDEMRKIGLSISGVSVEDWRASVNLQVGAQHRAFPLKMALQHLEFVKTSPELPTLLTKETLSQLGVHWIDSSTTVAACLAFLRSRQYFGS